MNKERKAAANKGFSLVELIIVIAIMAILGVVLAPQFTKYVERSRTSTDKQNVATIVNALEVYYIDPEVTSDKQIKNNATIELTTTNTAVSATNCKDNTELALKNAGITSIGLKSTTWNSNTGKLKLTVTITDGILSISADDENIFK